MFYFPFGIKIVALHPKKITLHIKKQKNKQSASNIIFGINNLLPSVICVVKIIHQHERA